MEDETKIIIEQMKKLLEKYENIERSRSETVSSGERKATCVPGDVCNVGEVEES